MSPIRGTAPYETFQGSRPPPQLISVVGTGTGSLYALDNRGRVWFGCWSLVGDGNEWQWKELRQPNFAQDIQPIMDKPDATLGCGHSGVGGWCPECQPK